MENKYSIKFYKRVVKIVGYVFDKLYRPVVVGQDLIPTEGPYIIVGNHTSMLDIPFVSSTLGGNPRFMAKSELFKTKFTKYFFTRLGTIPVNRNIVDVNAMKVSIKVLRNNEILVLFPEGTRSKTGELLPFKEGATGLASRTNSPILPFGISGKYKIGGGITITFGEPLIFEDKKIDQTVATEHLKNKVKELIIK